MTSLIHQHQACGQPQQIAETASCPQALVLLGVAIHKGEHFVLVLKAAPLLHTLRLNGLIATDGGTEVSSAAMMADKAHSSYFKHQLDGKETKTPGVGWFARVARGALLGYLRSLTLTPESENPQLIELAFEKAGLRLKAKRPLEQHTVVTLDDVEYR